MKKLIKKVLNKMGLTIIATKRANQILLPHYARFSFSQEGEDMLMREFFEYQNIRDGFYVDVGAFHPRWMSNTAYYYRQGWRGINVEPNPQSFKLFEKERPEDINLNVGVADKKGELAYYYYGENSAENTFSQEHVERIIKLRGEHPAKTLTVPVIDLNEVCAKAQGREIDFMTIDVESFELPILQSMNFEKYRPKMILVEILHTTMEDLLENEIYKLLLSKDYSLYGRTMRTFFFKRADLDNYGRNLRS